MLAALVVSAGLLLGAQQPERIVDIQVQGNALSADAQVIELAGLAIGMPLDANTIDAATDRLRQSRKFEHVEILKRFASIADPSQITLVIVVDEGPVTIAPGGRIAAGPDSPPSAVIQRRSGLRLMFLPIIGFEDGYGFSYGLRFAVPEPFGKGTRMSFPATWGGEKRFAGEFGWELTKSTRLQAGGEVRRRKNPFFRQNDDRGRLWLRGEKTLRSQLRPGVTAEWQHVSFGGVPDRFLRTGADITFDSRIDPMLARNAVYARAAWDHLAFSRAPDANRTAVDLRGYVGLVGQNVVIIRGLREDSDRSLPPYLRPLLGGTANLRGFKAGSAVGDTLVSASAELRVPMTSPLSFGKAGFSLFLDTASVYEKGQRVRDQHFEKGIGGGVWLSAALFQVRADVAHGVHRSTRAHFGVSVLF